MRKKAVLAAVGRVLIAAMLAYAVLTAFCCVYSNVPPAWLGTGKHAFLNCVGNLSAALQKYKPKEYVVIESAEISFTREALAEAVTGKTAELFAADSQTRVTLYQKMPWMITLRLYPRLVFENLFKVRKTEQSTAETDTPAGKKELLDQVLAKVSRESKAGDAGPGVIILYHPPVSLRRDGTMEVADDPAAVEQFAALCAENGLIFCDMRDRFQTEYEANHILPYGFANTSIGAGHLNRYGHAMIAEELYRIMEGGAG